MIVVSGEYRLCLQRKLNKTIHSSKRGNLSPSRLPSYIVRYIKQQPITGRVGKKNIYFDEEVSDLNGVNEMIMIMEMIMKDIILLFSLHSAHT